MMTLWGLFKMRISYSSSSLFLGCARKFWHKKVRDTPIDPDCEEDTNALRVGKAFHQILEECNHERSKCTSAIAMKSFEENDVLEQTQQGMILGMVDAYLKLHEAQGLKVIACEIEIGDDNLIGFVDAIMEDENGGWYIVDLKTAARLNNSLLSRLSKDPQLNIYSYYVPQISRMINLDPAKFKGTRYRVTTKATIKKNRKETLKEFIARVRERVEAFDIFIPAESLIPEQTHKSFMDILEKMHQVAELPEEKIPQNFGYCEQYFKPCEYWSRCYGKTFTDAAKQHVLTTVHNATKVTSEEDDDFLEYL